MQSRRSRWLKSRNAILVRNSDPEIGNAKDNEQQFAFARAN